MKKLLIVLISTLFLVGCEGIFDNTNIDPVEKPIVCNEGYELNTVTNICEEIDENIIDYEIGIEDNDTFYQLLVYAFNDSNGDGVGDFKGIAEKVDYFKYLGIEVIWLSPIHPASSYHHYDVEDYFDVDALYEVDGFTFEDMMEVLNENGIDVILDMVVNHSSNEHPYFIEAVNAFSTGVASEYTDYYILSESSFTHPLLGYNSAYTNGVYYDAFFGVSSMPAFDFDYQPVRDMWIDIFSYWLDKGVAGFRLDAAKHVYDDVELNNEVFNYFVDELALEYEDVYFVNEAWGGEEEIIAYYGSSMNNLNFTLKDKIDLALLGDRTFGTFLQTFQEAIRLENPNAIEANFISNHDIGRLGYGLSIEEQKLIAALNILIPGNSYIFYGDETSLVGDYELQSGYAGWEDSRYRTPMLWDDNTGVFADYISDVTASVADAYTTSTTTVEAAMADSDSLLNTYKKLIDIKSNLPIFSTGSISSVVLDENLISYQITEGDKYKEIELDDPDEDEEHEEEEDKQDEEDEEDDDDLEEQSNPDLIPYSQSIL